MKRIILNPIMMIILLVILCFCGIALCLSGCGTSYQEATNQVEDKSDDYGNGYFTIISQWDSAISNYYIVYANDTKVKYLIKEGGYQWGITPLYNTDGTLQIYEEE